MQEQAINNKAVVNQYVEIMNKDDNEETTSPPRVDQQFKEIQVEKERSTILAWLKERMTKEVIVAEEEATDKLDSFLEWIGQTIEKKKATKLSKITRDNIVSQIIQIATPRVDKPEDEITTDDYDLETIELGPTTVEQEIEDLSDSVKIVQDILRIELENKNKLERELNTLRNYVQQLRNPIRQDDPSSMPPSLLPSDSIDGLEEMRNNSHVVKYWIGNSFTKANEFVGELAHLFDIVSAILDRT